METRKKKGLIGRVVWMLAFGGVLWHMFMSGNESLSWPIAIVLISLFLMEVSEDFGRLVMGVGFLLQHTLVSGSVETRWLQLAITVLLGGLVIAQIRNCMGNLVGNQREGEISEPGFLRQSLKASIDLVFEVLQLGGGLAILYLLVMDIITMFRA